LLGGQFSRRSTQQIQTRTPRQVGDGCRRGSDRYAIGQRLGWVAFIEDGLPGAIKLGIGKRS
jgi:hypothetical protein